MVDVPVVVAQVPQVHVVMKTVETPRMQIVAETTEIPQLPLVEKIVMIPEIQTIHGPQTSESLSVDSRGLSHQDCEVLFHVNKQSPDIAGGVTEMTFTPEMVHGQQQHNIAAHSSTNKSNGQNRQRKKEKETKEKRGRKVREKESL